MRFTCRTIVLAGLVALLASPTLAQFQVDEAALIDDLPQDRKENVKSQANRPQKPSAAAGRNAEGGDSPPSDILPKVPGKSPPSAADRTTLVDDVTEARNDGRNDSQGASAIPDNLVEVLALVLHNNPGVLVAEAKVRQSQAELNEVRQTAVHDVTLVFQRWSKLQKLVKSTKGQVPAEAAAERDRELREDEAKLIYLLGIGGNLGTNVAQPRLFLGRGEPSGVREPAVPQPSASGRGNKAVAGAKAALPDAMRRFLDVRLDMDFTEASITDVLAYVTATARADAAEFVLQAPDEWDPAKEPSAPLVTLQLRQVTVGGALQALADRYDSAFVFRDYGVFVLGPGLEDDTLINSFRAAGTPMIAPPAPASGSGMGGAGMMGGLGGTGGGMGGMGRMGGGVGAMGGGSF
ncbi:MAG TPA: hypothetical protein VHC22_17385 [Pirellulales bacterium]|nr:hypothetical protein [Pirellulales bacterium]